MRHGRSESIFKYELVESSHGHALILAAGEWSTEIGGHRWQRIPPNEKRGRVHTSTVTVAVFAEDAPVVTAIDWARDVDESVARGSGAGGQHRNKTESAIRLHHRPTGIVVTSQAERSQHRNRDAARRELERRVLAVDVAHRASSQNQDRRQQVGSGMRGDKVRTYRARDDRWTDHVTGRVGSVRAWLAGRWD